MFIEKPLAASAADARELVAAAEKGDRRLMVGHLLLFHPALTAVRDLIRSDELGEIYYLYGNRVNLGQVRAEPMTLVNGYERLTLKFDCRACEMHVIGKIKKHIQKTPPPTTVPGARCAPDPMTTPCSTTTPELTIA